MADDPYYKVCARDGADCSGRVTWEHAFIYAGKQINEKWAIIPLCWYHYLGAGMNKRINEAIALSRTKSEDFEKYPRKNWAQMLLQYGL